MGVIMGNTDNAAMNWLAFDTSTDVLSVAVSRDDQVWAQDSAGGAQASLDGLPTIARLMQAAHLRWADVQAIVMGRGPGAFTGLRTACAMAQGLAWGADRLVLPIDTLLAVAESAYVAYPTQRGRDRMWVVMDARMAQVYVAAYERVSPATEPAQWHCVVPPQVCAPQDLVPPPQWAGTAYCIAGHADAAFARLDPSPWPEACAGVPRLHALPRATALLRLAPQAWASGQAVPPEAALPLYVRDKVAQTTQERLADKAARAGLTVAGSAS